jgi:MraZ protein
MERWGCTFLLITMNSHGIPIAQDEDGKTKRGNKRPQVKKSQVRFHTGTRLHLFADPARERADIPPGGARSRKIPETGQGGGSSSGSSSIRRFLFRGQEKVHKALARRFRGESHHKVDTKGRVSIPAPFRDVIKAADPDYKEGGAPQLVIVYGDHRRSYLECYTMEAIEQVDDKIDALPRGSNERKMLQRLFHGQSFPTTIDETGRLVLPAKLRNKIDLSGEAFFIARFGSLRPTRPKSLRARKSGLTSYPMILTRFSS